MTRRKLKYIKKITRIAFIADPGLLALGLLGQRTKPNPVKQLRKMQIKNGTVSKNKACRLYTGLEENKVYLP